MSNTYLLSFIMRFLYGYKSREAPSVFAWSLLYNYLFHFCPEHIDFLNK